MDAMASNTIDAYRVIRKIGEGGMGVVYEAVNDAIERRVAIKVLHSEYAKNADATARFFNEARAVNRIEHPGLVQISDYAQLPDGTAYLVMEYLKGESLASRMERGRLSVGQSLDIAWQIADALGAAHAKGVIHRDLKPDNVMLVADAVAPRGERAKLVDFGIAKLVEAARAGHLKTSTNMLMGTPRYMAPEQCKGAREADDKADVYALGVMLFEMMSGQVPFNAEGHGEILAMHIYDSPPPIQSLVPGLPSNVIELIQRLLTKDKFQRPSMRAVFEELGKLTGLSEPNSACRFSTRYVNSALVSKSPSAELCNENFGNSTGQRIGLTQIGSRLKSCIIAGGGLLVLGGGLTWLPLRLSAFNSATLTGNPAGTSHSQVVPERVLTWTIRSQPSGADVIRVRDGAVLGRTPWLGRQAFSTGVEELRLRLSGYQDRVITIERGGHVDLVEQLEPLAPPAADVQPAAMSPVSTHKGSSNKRKSPANFGHAHGPVQAED